MLTPRSDSDFESSNVSLKGNKPDGVNPNSSDIDYGFRQTEYVNIYPLLVSKNRKIPMKTNENVT